MPKGRRPANIIRVAGWVRALCAASLLAAVATAAAGCGDVYADLDVRRQATTEPYFDPISVHPSTVLWLEVRARFDDGAQASVEKHGFDGTQGVSLAYDSVGFFPGPCPSAEVSQLEAETAEGAALQAEPVDATGAHVFCTAVEVGAFDITTTVDVAFVFWNGRESVTGNGQLPVVVEEGVE